MIDGNMGHLPRGTLEMFRDTHTAQIRHDNGDMVGKPVLAFHWLYPRGDAHPEMRTFSTTSGIRARSAYCQDRDGVDATLDIDYEVMNAHGMVYNSGMYAKWTPETGT